MNYNKAELCKDCKKPVEKNVRQVAMTIKRQIGASTLMELGAHKFMTINWSRGALEFNIKYKSNRTGTVTIILVADDTYTLIMTDYRHRRVVEKDTIYADQLSRVLRSGFKKLRGER